MKRSWLIAGGTLGGLGAVMAITPPQLSSNGAGGGIGLIPAPTQSTPATNNPKPAASQTAAPAATSAASNQAQSGTFIGDPSTMRYGTVQVQITINNGTITDAIALKTPTGENQRYTDRAIPTMRQKTLAAQSSQITGVSGASYTAFAWYTSLQSALSKAGWM